MWYGSFNISGGKDSGEFGRFADSPKRDFNPYIHEANWKMLIKSKNKFVIFILYAFFSLLFGYALLWMLRLVNSFYEEIFAALLIGFLGFVQKKRFKLCLIGGTSAMIGWLIGLKLSEYMGQKLGLSIGTWLLLAIAVFLILALQRFIERKIIRGMLMLLSGIFVGLIIEILHMLPAFISAFRFKDFQAFAVIGASVLIIPLTNVLLNKKETKDELKNNKT
jgi:hypothetical protein